MKYEDAFEEEDGHKYLKGDFPPHLTNTQKLNMGRLFGDGHSTGGHTKYLKALIKGEYLPTDDDILALWHVLRDSAGYVGQPATLMDFGHWLTGTLAPNDVTGQPCEVTW